jgi:hypothetical protein
MSDPVRLVSGGATDFEQHLLRSWATKQPSDEARARVLGLVGVGMAAGLTAAAASAASPGLAPGVASASAAAKVSFGSAMLIKWLALGAACMTLAAGAVGYALHATSAPATAPPVAAVPVSPSTAAPTTPAAPVAQAAAVSGPTQAPETVAAAPARAIASNARPREASTLDDEVATLERARRAIAAGDGASAIAVVDGYDARYPGGSLSQESTEIRIDALLRRGDRTTAERLASRFIAAHPSSPYVRRIRALLAHPR